MRLWFVLLLFLGQVCGDNAVHITAAVRLVESGGQAYKQREYGDAAEDFRKAIAVEPTFAQAFEGLIRTYLAAGQQTQAAEWITKYLQIDPSRSEYRVTLGGLLLKGRQPQRALAQFATVLKQDSGNAEALFGFAEAAKQCGMNDRAVEAMARGRQLHPQDPRFKSNGQ